MDWWAVGCLLYEFLIGCPPFSAKKLDQVFTNIKNYNILWPEVGYGEDKITPEAKDLIEKFLTKDP